MNKKYVKIIITVLLVCSILSTSKIVFGAYMDQPMDPPGTTVTTISVSSVRDEVGTGDLIWYDIDSSGGYGITKATLQKHLNFQY